MAATATILSQTGRRVRWRFDFDSGAQQVHERTIGEGQDAQVVGNTLAVRFDQREQRQELELGWTLFAAGVDLDLEAWHFNTLNAIREYALKRLLNLMRSSVSDEAKGQIASNAIVYVNKFTDVQIAGLLDAPNWTSTKVGNARTKLTSLADAFDAVDHGEPAFDDAP